MIVKLAMRPQYLSIILLQWQLAVPTPKSVTISHKSQTSKRNCGSTKTQIKEMAKRWLMMGGGLMIQKARAMMVIGSNKNKLHLGEEEICLQI